ncbi:uncharacterized protein LOC111064824 [Drosophila obscura]|uniref:uncharacterized protein LOC111064824 n=1 Tax=Drosophila obscura TaxID=7282 RepID=UPI001BB241E0|nr:uncharacterized protein LOC111064824 [Drosophila obscura]XP_022208313.2 uncharacterized protein LOC111064824 [Drosophila obscura]
MQNNSQTNTQRTQESPVTPSELTPPQLTEIGLLTTTRMSKLQQLAKLRTGNHNDELFVKRPTFSKRGAASVKPAASQLGGECLPTVDLVEEENIRTIRTQVGALEQRFTHFMNGLRAQRWMWSEFALSFIDEPIAASVCYDLDRFMKDLGCMITTRTMPRRCWQMVRNPIGKPRRFSRAFIASDGGDWQKVRDLVRQMQQGTFDIKQHETNLPLLPSRIPMPLPMDARVTAFLPNGFGHGVVVSHEPKDNTYLVRLNIGAEKSWLHLIDTQLQGEMGCESLPLSIMMAVTDEPEPEEVVYKPEEKAATFSSAGYSQTLLESVVTVKNLLSIKDKTVRDFTALNKDFESLSTQSSSRRDPKAEREQQQRRFAAHMITLHRVNDDMLEPLRVLHQYLDEYKDVEDQKAKTLSARERFQQCRLQADLDLKAVETQLGLVVKADATRDLIRTLHTILYLCGALSGENSSDIRTIINDIVASTMENLPPVLCAQFKQMIFKITPLCESFGRVPKQPQEEEDAQPMYANDYEMVEENYRSYQHQGQQETFVQRNAQMPSQQDVGVFEDMMEPLLHNLLEE